MAGRLNLRVALTLFALLMAIGTGGYMLTEGWSPGRAFYAAVTTLTTLGVERPTTPAGMAFTVVFVLGRVATSFYILSSLVIYVAEGQLSQRMRRQRMDREIARLHGHYIIRGYGRVGRRIVAAAEAQGYSVIPGSPVTDEVLHQARLVSARGLIAATDDDAENIYRWVA